MSDPYIPPINRSVVQRPGTPGDSADATRMTNIEARLDAVEALPIRPIVSNLYYGPMTTLVGWFDGLDPLTMTQNVLYASPFQCPAAATFDVFGVPVTTAVASSTIRIGVYAAGGDGYPATLVEDLGTVDTSATGWRSNVCDLDLDPGVYWIGGACSHAGVAVSGIVSASNPGMTAYLGNASSTGPIAAIALTRDAALSGGFSALPAPFGAASIYGYAVAFQLQAE